MRTLYCPNCDYNLTGLPENRCPECGLRFDPQRLAALTGQPLRPIAPWVAGLHCLAWLTAFWLTAFLCVASMSFPGLAVLVFVSLGFLGHAMEDARDIAARLAVRRAVRAGYPGALLDFNPDTEARHYVRTVTLAIVLAMLLAAFLLPVLVFLSPQIS